MRTAIVGLVGMLVVACGGPSNKGQGAKTPQEMLEEQERIAEEEERQRKEHEASLDDSEETDLEKRKKFDKRQAKLELQRAGRSAATCPGVVDEEGPGGEAEVSLTFANDGHVKESSISSEFEDTKLGKCILRAMEAVIVPAYEGDEVSVDWKVELEEPEEKDDKKKK